MSSLTEKIKNLSSDQLKDFLKTMKEKNKSNYTKKVIKGIERDVDFYDVSFAQRRLWFLDQLVSGNPFYNMPTAVKIIGNLDNEILERSLNHIIKRHEVLRTVFSDINGKPVQVMLSELQIPLIYRDLSQLAVEEKNARLEEYLNEEALRSFDLKQGPLLRASLYKMDDFEYIMAVTMHHIVSDGWSLGIFVKEICMVYDTLINGREILLPKLPIQYVDFTMWQKEWFTGELYEKQFNYWREKLKDAPQLLGLTTDYQRPSVPSFIGKRIYFELPEKLTANMKQIAKDNNATLFMVLLTAFNVLLYKYTNQEDILVGSPIANRHRTELEGLIGYFANTLVIRTELGGDPTFSNIVEQVRETTLGAYDHQDLPFERIVEELNLKRDMSYTPLFQVSFALQNAPMPAIKSNEITIEPLKIESGTSKFDLWLSMVEVDAYLQGTLEYSIDLFKPETIKHMVTHFKEVLNSIAENPTRKLSEINITTKEEKDKILHVWNQTDKDFIKDKSLIQVFEENVEKYPEKTALVFENEELTYNELNQRANRLAVYIKKRGVNKSDLVGIYLERSIEMIVAILAILKNGAGYVPIDTVYPKERVSFILDDSRADILLTDIEYAKKVPEDELSVIYLDQIKDILEYESKENIDIKVSSEEIAYIIYTSGSTGKPKGVRVMHQNVTRLMTATEDWFHFDEKDTWTLFHSYAFDFSIWEIWGPFFYGGKLIIVPYLVSRSPEKFYDLVCDKKVTVLNQTPSAFAQFIEADKLSSNNNLSLRYVIFGGEALNFQRLAPWFNRHGDKKPQLINMYGITETTVHVTYYPIKISDVEENKGSVIGVPIPDLQVYVLDENRNISPIGVPGEIYVGGNGVSKGYLNRPELTEEKFITDYFREDNSRLYKTGDLARYLSDGNLEYLGRIDTQVKIRGFRIELGEIETLLRKHEAVKDSVVMVREDVPGDKRLVSYIIPDDNYAGSATEETGNLIEEQVEKWRIVFNDYYTRTPTTNDCSFNIVGWNSSYSDSSIPAEEMREWLDTTIARIKSLQPEKALEIGYGTGMILYQIAPECQEYWGSDLSPEAKRYVEEQLDNLNLDVNVTLMERSADNFIDIEDKYFDTVIINSVIQYFPDIEYLVTVLKKAVKAVKSGGSLFLGDLRSLPLQRAFHTSVELFKADGSLELEQLEKNIEWRMKYDSELVLNPTLFLALKDQLPEIRDIEVLVKEGDYHNELTCFRFDAIIHIGEEREIENKRLEWNWQKDELVFEEIERVIAGENPEQILIKYVTNKRIIKDVLAVKMIEENSLLQTATDLKEAIDVKGLSRAVDPKQFWSLESKFDYDVDIYLSFEKEDSYHVLLTRKGSNLAKASYTAEMENFKIEDKVDWSNYTNNPLQSLFDTKITPELNHYLRDKLPEYMVPSAFVIIDEIKMNTNGKVDKKALPMPDIRMAVKDNFVPPSTPLEKLLADLYSRLLSVDKVGINDNFFELGGHSLLATQLIFKLRDMLGINLPLRVLFETPTIAGMAEAVERLKADSYKNNENITLKDLKKDAVLEKALANLTHDYSYQGEYSNLLLTGATGFLGSYLLAELLLTTEANVFCLVRGTDQANGKERIKYRLEMYQLWDDKYSPRIIPVIGDLSRKYFGLSKESFNELSKKIDLIYHNGALVNFIYPYSALRDANVGGTHEIVRLAVENGVKPIHYVSTLYIFAPRDKNGPYVFNEGDDLEKGGVPQMGYTQSKWAAENLLLEAKEAGCPVTIYRPGRIAGHSGTGACQSKDFLWKLIKGSIQLGYFPELDVKVDIAPVDYVSSTIVHLSKKEITENKNYHIYNPEPIHFDRLVSWINDFGYLVKTIPYDEWLEKLEENSEDNALYELLPLFSGRGIERQILPVKFERDNTAADSVLECPEIDNNLLTTYLDYFVSIGFLDAPME